MYQGRNQNVKGANEGLRWKEQAQEAKEENEGVRRKIKKGADRVKGENKMHEGDKHVKGKMKDYWCK